MNYFIWEKSIKNVFQSLQLTIYLICNILFEHDLKLKSIIL